ncbi:MAG: hypothetical protein MI861_17855, partial [Pirellulales bacterium]|nr:hypothetical protein [Pirellulales bacterium]
MMTCLLLAGCGAKTEEASGGAETNRQPLSGEAAESNPKSSTSEFSQQAKSSPDTEPDESDEPPPQTVQASAADPNLVEPNLAAKAGGKSLQEQLAEFEIPPAWLESVELHWDTSKPWKEARLEVRRLLGTNVEQDRREGIKLLWHHYTNDDIGDGHEYGFDLYLGGEWLWAIKEYRRWLPQERDYLFVRGHTSLASLYVQYGEFELA